MVESFIGLSIKNKFLECITNKYVMILLSKCYFQCVEYDIHGNESIARFMMHVRSCRVSCGNWVFQDKIELCY